MKTVYVIMLLIPDKEFESMRNVIQWKHFTRNEKINYWTGIYAWTTKKDLINIFKMTRNMNIFTIKKTSMDHDEYVDFKTKYSELKLDIRPYRIISQDTPKDKEPTADIVSTEFEFMNVTDYYEEKIDELLNECTTTDYRMFKGLYRDALDYILYATFFCKLHDHLPMEYILSCGILDDDTINYEDAFNDFLDESSYNSSYGIKMEGVKGDTMIVNSNEFTLFIHLYKFLFIK